MGSVQLGEAVIGLLFVAPVAVVAFIFELFPVIYGFYLSLLGGDPTIPRDFVGIQNFVRAIGSLAYMIAFAVAAVMVSTGYGMYTRAKAGEEAGQGKFTPYLAPGFLTAVATIGLFLLIFTNNLAWIWIPLVTMVIGVLLFSRLQARRADKVPEDQRLMYVINAWGVGVTTLGAVLLTVFTLTELVRISQPLLNVVQQVITDSRYNFIFPLAPQLIMLGGIAASVMGVWAAHRVFRQFDEESPPLLRAGIGLLRWIFALIAIFCVVYILGAQEMLRQSIAHMEARVTAEQLREFTRVRLPTLLNTISQWSEVFTMLLGIGLVGGAYFFWSALKKRESNVGWFTTLMIAISLMVGGWLLIGELPTAAGRGDSEFYNSLVRTVTYAIATVPVQLGLGLGLAYLLFYEVKWGKGFYRLVFFIPYIAPVVATATVFAMLFSNDPNTGAVNQVLKAFGIPAQEWLRNPKGVFQIIAETVGGRDVRLPEFLVGPSLPMIAAVLYSIWVFSGYNAVIFMNGLANVPKDMFEAAQVDGAGRWKTFRHIVFPLISPTTFYLTLLAIIGTFRAFTHIYVIRTESMRGALDTTTIYIYQTILVPNAISTRSYAAAMSFLLFGIILLLTIAQNRLTRDKVFYG